jgi:hypothetical protein
MFLWFQAFSLNVECSVLTAGFGHQTVQPPLAILNGTSNPIGLHNKHSLFQRVLIHLHYGVKASKHLASLLTTDWQRERQAGCVVVSLRLDYLYLIFLCCQLPFCEFSKHRTALHYGYDMQMYCTFLPFCKSTFSGGYPRVGHTVFFLIKWIVLYFRNDAAIDDCFKFGEGVSSLNAL